MKVYLLANAYLRENKELQCTTSFKTSGHVLQSTSKNAHAWRECKMHAKKNT